MAFAFNLNNIFNRTVDLYLSFKDAWVASGHATVVQSGDGDAIGPANLADLNGDVLTVASSVNGTPNNIGNTLCWARIVRPDGREFLLQHGFFTGQNGYSLWYSQSAGFVQEAIGPVSPTVRPTASDEAQIVGSSGLSTTVTNRPIFSDGLAGYTGGPSDFVGRQVLQMCFGDADEDYSMYALSWIRGYREMRGGFFIDVTENNPTNIVDGAVIGTIGDEDNPLGKYNGIWTSGGQDGTPDTSNRRAYCWADAVNEGPNGLSMPSARRGAVYARTSTLMNRYGDEDGYPARGEIVGRNHFHAGHDDFGPVLWEIAYSSASFNPGRFGLIGTSRLFRNISNADELRDISDDLLWRFAGNVAIRWDGVTAPRVA